LAHACLWLEIKGLASVSSHFQVELPEPVAVEAEAAADVEFAFPPGACAFDGEGLHSGRPSEFVRAQTWLSPRCLAARGLSRLGWAAQRSAAHAGRGRRSMICKICLRRGQPASQPSPPADPAQTPNNRLLHNLYRTHFKHKI
jgi:hypothetical protein